MLPALGKRLISATVLAAFVILAVFWFPSWAQVLTLMLISAAALVEFYAFLGTIGIPTFRGLGLGAGAALQAVTWFTYFRPCRLSPAECELMVLAVLVMAILVMGLRQKGNNQLVMTLGGTLLGTLYIPFLFNFFIKLLMEWGADNGRFLVLYMLLVVKWSDAGAYFVGCGCGRHKLIPRISPGKTWEGLAGGLLTGMGVSLIVFFCSGVRAGAVHFTLLDAVTIGLLLSIAGVLGDLVESLFKRAVGVKDSSGIIHGMGGLLDVLDSLIFSAPVFYICARLLLAA